MFSDIIVPRNLSRVSDRDHTTQDSSGIGTVNNTWTVSQMLVARRVVNKSTRGQGYIESGSQLSCLRRDELVACLSTTSKTT
jgi:hypothetical protein